MMRIIRTTRVASGATAAITTFFALTALLYSATAVAGSYSVELPKGTQSVKITYIVVDGSQISVPQTSWDTSCHALPGPGNEHRPWNVELYDLNTFNLLFQDSGTYLVIANPVANACPRDQPPPPLPDYPDPVMGTQATYTRDVDVSALTAAGPADILLGYTGVDDCLQNPFPGIRGPSPDLCLPGAGLSFVAPDPPTFTFALTSEVNGDPNQARLLTRIRAGDSYFSGHQLNAASTVPPNATRPQMSITGVVGHPPHTNSIWFKLLDPPDPAPYVPAADSFAGDNLDTSALPRLMLADGTLPVQGYGVPLHTTWDAGHGVSLILEGSDHVAGDNYQVIASFDPPGSDGKFPCEAQQACDASPVITVWKRLYVEEEHMFRQGSFLLIEARASGTEIPVDDPAPFQNLALHDKLELVHADPATNSFYSDFVGFKSITQNATSGIWSIETDGPIPRYYGSMDYRKLQGSARYMRDGVGVVSAGVYEPESSYVSPLYDTMYVDVRMLEPPTVTEVPKASLTRSSMLFLANRWRQFGGSPIAAGMWLSAQPNVLHRLGVWQTEPIQNGLCSGVELGATFVGSGGNGSLILVGRMEDVIAGTAADPNSACPAMGMAYLNAPLSRVNGEVTAHETTHMWVHDAITATMDGQGHCAQQRYQHDGLECLMHKPYNGQGLFDGLVDLHYEHASGSPVDSEYIWIRTAGDPVSQQ